MKSTKFAFSDEEFINVLNKLCDKDAPLGDTSKQLSSMEDSINVDKLDSLGMIIFFIWVTELFGISEELLLVFMDEEVFTITAIKTFVVANQTRIYTYAESERYTAKCF